MEAALPWCIRIIHRSRSPSGLLPPSFRAQARARARGISNCGMHEEIKRHRHGDLQMETEAHKQEGKMAMAMARQLTQQSQPPRTSSRCSAPPARSAHGGHAPGWVSSLSFETEQRLDQPPIEMVPCMHAVDRSSLSGTRSTLLSITVITF